MKFEEIAPDFRRLLANSVKQGGMSIRDPVAGADRLHQASKEATAALAKSLREGGQLDSVEHKQCVRAAGAKARKERVAAEKVFVALEKAAKAKKDKYLDACLERRKSFTPLVYSVDGMACKEARAFEKRITSLLASK